MIELSKCKTILEQKNISDEYFIKLHITLEGYLKRLLFIGLRTKDVQYKTAQESITKYHEILPNMISKIWLILGIDYKNDLLKFGKYKILEEYVLNFTSKYRNYRVHGIYDEIKDHELLRCLILIDKAFINEIEKYLKTKKMPSAFDEPKKWGAKVSKIKSVDDVFNNILET
ncbi:MAG: hypothetical protein BWY27_00008 [Bacteroidetes bacterium ADurb.Bin234]|nr:MAG: hypothetical protein BWY27_00008 [Bacteroidetes bacterium ADurb.Bin234]